MSGGKLWVYISGAGVYTYTGIIISHNEWQHLLISTDGGDILNWNIYLNGVKKEWIQSESITPVFGGVSYIGALYGLQSFYGGGMSDVFIQNREWSQAQALLYYNDTKANYGL